MELKPGYKQTEVGVIPEEWEVKRLGEIGKVVRGGSPRPAGDPKFFDGDFIPWLTVAALTNIPDHQLEVRHTESRLTEEGSKRSRTLQPGTVIIANSGATLGVAKVSAIKCCANDGVAAIIDQHIGDKAFICHCINAQTQRLREVVATGNGQPNLNTGLIKEIAIPWPPQVEQAAIAECFSDLDKLLQSLEDAVVKKQRLKQSAMQELLTGKRRLPGFEGEWETIRLGDHVKYLKNGTNSRAELRADGRVKYLHYGNVHASSRSFASPYDLPSLPVSKAAGLDRLKDGDLIFADASEDIAGVSKSVEIYDSRESEVVSGLHTIAARFEKSVLADGFKGFLQYIPTFSEHLRRLAAGTKVYATNRVHISSAEVQLPPVSEQRAIAAFLSEMDAELAALEARLKKARDLKHGMLQELLTGRIRLQ